MIELQRLLPFENLKVKYATGCATRSSEDHPARNEDSMLADPENGVFGVFDGVSGSKNGWYAASKASQIFSRNFFRLPPDVLLTDQNLEGIIKDTLNIASKELQGGDTTASVMKVWQTSSGEKNITYGHIGDSRIYLYDIANNRLTTVTDDHGILLSLKPSRAKTIAKKFDEVLVENELCGTENIQVEYPDSITHVLGYKEYTSERALFYNRQVLLRSLGRNSDSAKIATRSAAGYDLAILTTDGVHDNLTTSQIIGILQRNAYSPQQAARTLAHDAQLASRVLYKDGANAEKARNIRAKPDDMSAIVVSLHR